MALSSESDQDLASAHHPSQIDRLLTTALTVSLAGHAMVLGAQLIGLWWRGPVASLKPVKLIYEGRREREASSWTQDASRYLQSRLQDAAASSRTAPAASMAGQSWERGGHPDRELGMSAAETQIKIAESLGGGLGATAFSDAGVWASAIDLTNVASAAHGDPVLLSYFSAIRAQIQETADAHPWLPHGADKGGTVYVGFVVTRTGAIRSADVVADRSVGSAVLRDAALRIITSSVPFLPFPPSIQDASQTVVVPIEFSSGP